MHDLIQGAYALPADIPAAQRAEVEYLAEKLSGILDGVADPKLAAKKLGEEALETALATTPEETAAESADLIYHWLALLQARGVSLDAVAEKLEAREGTSGIAEKAGRKG